MSAFGAGNDMDAFSELDKFLAAQSDDEQEQQKDDTEQQPVDEFDDLLNTRLGDVSGDEQAEDQKQAQATPQQPSQSAPQAQSDDLRDTVSMLARMAADREEREARARQMLEEEQLRKQQAAAAKLYDDNDLQLTDEEKQTYGQSEGVIAKVARTAVQSYHDKFVAPLMEELRQYRESTKHIEQRVVQTQEQSVMSRLSAVVPDLNERTKSAGWTEFVNRQAPYMQRGVTMGQLIDHHLKAGDVDAAAEVIRAYEHQSNTPARVAASTPTPRRMGGGGPPASVASRQTGSEKLPFSKFNKATEMAERGQITPERYNKIMDLYLEAEEKGLVDYSK